MRLLLCGGGTAGHVNPALAIGETVEKNIPNSEIAYVVTEKGIENVLVPYKKYVIKVKGLKGKFKLSNIKVIYLLLKSFRDCRKIINEFKPEIVVGTGGYSCFPVIYTAHKMGVKTIIHESNAYPGKTARSLSRYVDKILVNYAESKSYFGDKEKIVVTGNPYLKGFLSNQSDIIRKPDKKIILIFGGSLGAEKINECAYKICKEILQKREDVKLIWGCGKREYNKYKAIISELRCENIELKDYIDNMPELLSCVDIVICRSGAISVSEMAFKKKCTIFIPSPNVTDNHQYKNAKVLDEKSAAILLEEKNLDNITSILTELLDNKELRMKLERNIEGFCVRNSNKIIFDEIKKVSMG